MDGAEMASPVPVRPLEGAVLTTTGVVTKWTTAQLRGDADLSGDLAEWNRCGYPKALVVETLKVVHNLIL
jgi:hypothetical protein